MANTTQTNIQRQGEFQIPNLNIPQMKGRNIKDFLTVEKTIFDFKAKKGPFNQLTELNNDIVTVLHELKGKQESYIQLKANKITMRIETYKIEIHRREDEISRLKNKLTFKKSLMDSIEKQLFGYDALLTNIQKLILRQRKNSQLNIKEIRSRARDLAVEYKQLQTASLEIQSLSLRYGDDIIKFKEAIHTD